MINRVSSTRFYCRHSSVNSFLGEFTNIELLMLGWQLVKKIVKISTESPWYVMFHELPFYCWKGLEDWWRQLRYHRRTTGLWQVKVLEVMNITCMNTWQGQKHNSNLVYGHRQNILRNLPLRLKLQFFIILISLRHVNQVCQQMWKQTSDEQETQGALLQQEEFEQ